jgi:uncharacterized protein (DUF924 family)
VEEHETLLAFWFGAGTPEHLRPRSAWFTTDPVFDAEVRARFQDDLQRALRGERSAWANARESCLALVILCDQVPRNLFRGDARAFSTDPLARAGARIALDRGDDEVVAPVQRWFLYLPFEHSEDLDDQRTSVALFERLRDDPDSAVAIEYAHKHLAIVERFGRFPHRNRSLGRASTPEEEAFLRTPGSSLLGVEAERTHPQ